MLSLAVKTTTQSILIGKLSAYARKNKTKRALWEYDNFIRSLYFLNYIDSPPLRHNVQKALNRGESYHKLRKAVSYANFSNYALKTKMINIYGVNAADYLLIALFITTPVFYLICWLTEKKQVKNQML